ncbi:MULTISPECIES: Gfo/Idh/MocA family oxidoreductase [Micrococcaceae]|uniref:Gfo/Idh/MocA family oxidoreductase n=1 Tax=Micrococcaceae TaxID=1268 RepID=UPI0009E9E6B4|nr:Gfo/Idh/MocA family oxidoreductase [Arthrobacter sp. Soil761]
MTTPSPSRIAFIGCGNIAGPYAESLSRHSELALVGVFDLDESKRRDFAAEHSCTAYSSLDELCADTPDVVVNLTSAPYHYATTLDLIDRGQTVFSEKPLAMNHREAQELVKRADEKNVRLACAPSLWLGAASLSVADAIQSGTIGTVRLIHAEVSQGRIETWHPAPHSFYQVGPVVDAGVYPLTYLTAIFGPIRAVTAVGHSLLEERSTLDGGTFSPATADAWIVVAEFESGPMLRLSCNFYVHSDTNPRAIEFHGDGGSLRLDDWLLPGSSTHQAKFGNSYQIQAPGEDLPLDWCLGLADIAAALRENRPHRTTGEHAAHVVEVLDAIAQSADKGNRVEVTSSFPSPLPARASNQTTKEEEMTNISFMGANLVAQQLDWSMTEGWMQGDDAANAYYEPIATFEERFQAFVDLVADAGFDALDVWTAQLNWTWATPAHLEAAQRVLSKSGMTVNSYAGGFGDTPAEFKAACNVAAAIGAPILGGGTSLLTSDRKSLVDILKASGRLLAIENHPEHKSAQDVIDEIGTDGEGLIGTAVDTGWWGTNGVDAAQAIRELGQHVMYIHMKDIREAGAHETCALGEGIVPITDCLSALSEIGYTGPMAIEHEPEHSNPVQDVILSKKLLLGWLGELRNGTPFTTAGGTS